MDKAQFVQDASARGVQRASRAIRDEEYENFRSSKRGILIHIRVLRLCKLLRQGVKGIFGTVRCIPATLPLQDATMHQDWPERGHSEPLSIALLADSPKRNSLAHLHWSTRRAQRFRQGVVSSDDAKVRGLG